MKRKDYIKKSKYRMKVIKSLENDAKIPSVLAEETDIYKNHISNTLKQLKDKNLVECSNPEVRKGRLYRLTDDGEKILDDIKKEEKNKIKFTHHRTAEIHISRLW